MTAARHPCITGDIRALALTRLRKAAADGAFDLTLLADKANYRR